MHPIAPRVNDIEAFQVMEIAAAARALEAAGQRVVHMEIGEPDFPTPPPVIAAATAYLAQGGVYYSSALGIWPLREAIAAHYATCFGVSVKPEQIIVTAGASAALLLVMALLIGRDDEILMTDPNYPCNRHFARFLEGRAVPLPVGPDSAYQLNAAQVEAAWTARTHAVLLASPANPTGTSVPPAELAAIARAVAARQGRLIVDEIYQGLSYGAPARTVLSIAPDAFVINSFSKFWSMTGWRLGWIVAPEAAVRDIEKLAQNLFISPSAVAQHAALACFSEATLAINEERRQAFEARRNLLVAGLRDLGFGVPILPDGGFFVYADCARFSADAHAFCFDTLQRAAVAFSPGTDFGSYRAKEHVRFAYAVSEDKLAMGIERLRRALRST